MDCSTEMYRRNLLNLGHRQVLWHRAACLKLQTGFSHRNARRLTWNLSPFRHWLILVASSRLWKKKTSYMVKKTKSTITEYVRMLRREVKGMKAHTTRTQSRFTILTMEESVEAVNPQIFRVGDIVEAQVSFIAVPLKDKKHKMIIVMRSIALLDPSFSQVSYLSYCAACTLTCCSYSQTCHCS